MTDRFLRACRHQSVDRTPVWFMRQAGRIFPEYQALRKRFSLVELTRHPDLCAEITLHPVRLLGVDAAILFADITLPLLGMGVEVEIRDGIGPVIASPIRHDNEIARLASFDPHEHTPALLEAIGLIRRDSPVPLIGFAGAPFTLASYLVEGGPSREFQKVKDFMHSAPSAWDRLMTRLTDATIVYLTAQVAAGVQVVQVFDSWVGCLSPFDYQLAILPHMRRLFGSLRDVPVIHFGTNTAGLLELMVEAGGDVIGVDWRVSLDAAWMRLGECGIQGNLDPAVAAGPFEVARRHTEMILRLAGGRSGHIFNLGHGVLPHTPVDNLRRLVDVVHEMVVGVP